LTFAWLNDKLKLSNKRIVSRGKYMSEITTIRHGGYPEPIKKNKMRTARLHKHKHGLTHAELRENKINEACRLNTQYEKSL